MSFETSDAKRAKCPRCLGTAASLIIWTTGARKATRWPYWHRQMWEYVGAHY